MLGPYITTKISTANKNHPASSFLPSLPYRHQGTQKPRLMGRSPHKTSVGTHLAPPLFLPASSGIPGGAEVERKMVMVFIVNLTESGMAWEMGL